MPKYYKEVILKDNTFWLLSKNELKNSRSLMSTVNYGTKVLCMISPTISNYHEPPGNQVLITTNMAYHNLGWRSAKLGKNNEAYF